ncbi:MAG: hypothetical protein NC131_03215 [Roseburia sp.]|nr:hypothetical protein [Roseburia sp.]
MKSSKKVICLAVAAALVAGVAFTGCTVTMNEADVKQRVATVNIANSQAFADEFGEAFGSGYKSAVTEKVFLKRDMITAYYNGYYQLVQQGQSYSQVFDSIKDSLVSNAVTTQYATAYLLKSKIEDGEATFAEYTAKQSEAAKYEYLLGETAVKSAKYQLNVTLNSVLDSSESDFLEEESDDKYSGSETRSTPTGIDSTVEEYVPEGYNVYTGYENYYLEDAGDDYEPLDGTTKATRRKAYASFLSSLRSNYLITDADTKTTDIWEISYVKDSYVSQLQTEILSAYNEKIVEEKENDVNTVVDDKYTYIQTQYESLLSVQENDYASSSSFESAMGNISDTKFILYSPSTENDSEGGTFGYVYNILLPFSKVQEAQLSTLQSYRDGEVITESEYFAARNGILKNIRTTDQRAAWFNGSTDYSFNVKEYEEESGKTLGYFGKDAGREYLFFKNNVTDTENTQYNALEKYDGRYSYNGSVKKNTDGSYTLIPEKLDINGMLAEFEAYVNYVLGDGDRVDYTLNDGYYAITDFTVSDSDKEIDYSNLVYATGKVTLNQLSAGDMLITDKEHMTDRYKAMCAVNELQYAYTTDTGVLSQYIGYTVSAYDTSYIKEFEYAAKAAVKEGAGAFSVCAGDYGWHLIYVTESFKTGGGAVYTPDFSTERVNTEGTFENRFYNWKKDTELANEVSLKQSDVLKKYNNEKSVSVNKDAYKDLSGLN